MGAASSVHDLFESWKTKRGGDDTSGEIHDSFRSGEVLEWDVEGHLCNVEDGEFEPPP